MHTHPSPHTHSLLLPPHTLPPTYALTHTHTQHMHSHTHPPPYTYPHTPPTYPHTPTHTRTHLSSPTHIHTHTHSLILQYHEGIEMLRANGVDIGDEEDLRYVM